VILKALGMCLKTSPINSAGGVYMSRFKDWKYPEFDELGRTKYGWRCNHRKNFVLGKNTDIGAFTIIEAKYGVEIQEDAQVGSHCTIYSWSTIDDKHGKVTIKKNAKIGTHSVIMPCITIGENALVGAFSFVTRDVPDNATVWGIPAKAQRYG